MNRKLFSLLLSSDAGGGAPPPDAPNQPPPAASTVMNSDAKEADAAEIVRLKRENEQLNGKVKDRETRISELEDENHRLKTPATVPIKGAEKKASHGLTFFG